MVEHCTLWVMIMRRRRWIRRRRRSRRKRKKKKWRMILGTNFVVVSIKVLTDIHKP